MQTLPGISWHFQNLQFFSLDPRTQSRSRDTKWKTFASHSHHLSSVPCSCLPASLSVLFPKQTLLAPLRDHSFRPESYKPSCSAPIELWWAAFRRPRWKEPPSGPRGTYSISPQEGKNLKTVTATFRNHSTRKQKSKVTQGRIASLREYHPAAGRHECSVSPPALTSTASCSSNMCFPATFTYTAVKGKKSFLLFSYVIAHGHAQSLAPSALSPWIKQQPGQGLEMYSGFVAMDNLDITVWKERLSGWQMKEISDFIRASNFSLVMQNYYRAFITEEKPVTDKLPNWEINY